MKILHKILPAALVLLASAAMCHEKPEKNMQPFKKSAQITLKKYLFIDGSLHDDVFTKTKIPDIGRLYSVRDTQEEGIYTFTTSRFYFEGRHYATLKQISGSGKNTGHMKTIFSDYRRQLENKFGKPYSDKEGITFWDLGDNVLVTVPSTTGDSFTVILYDYEVTENLKNNHSVTDPFHAAL